MVCLAVRVSNGVGSSSPNTFEKVCKFNAGSGLLLSYCENRVFMLVLIAKNVSDQSSPIPSELIN